MDPNKLIRKMTLAILWFFAVKVLVIWAMVAGWSGVAFVFFVDTVMFFVFIFFVSRILDQLKKKIPEQFPSEKALDAIQSYVEEFKLTNCRCPSFFYSGCLCRYTIQENEPRGKDDICLDCWNGLHIFEAVSGNPPPHRRRSLQGHCEAHGIECNWYAVTGYER